jgi:hypothetical protein
MLESNFYQVNPNKKIPSRFKADNSPQCLTGGYIFYGKNTACDYIAESQIEASDCVGVFERLKNKPHKSNYFAQK